MMLYPSMSQLLKKVDSRYMLVNVVARRAREISAEAEETEEYLEEKSVSIAIKEIADGKISIIKHGEDNSEISDEVIDDVDDAADDDADDVADDTADDDADGNADDTVEDEDTDTESED